VSWSVVSPHAETRPDIFVRTRTSVPKLPTTPLSPRASCVRRPPPLPRALTFALHDPSSHTTLCCSVPPQPYSPRMLPAPFSVDVSHGQTLHVTLPKTRARQCMQQCTSSRDQSERARERPCSEDVCATPLAGGAPEPLQAPHAWPRGGHSTAFLLTSRRSPHDLPPICRPSPAEPQRQSHYHITRCHNPP